MNRREIKESPFYQGADEALSYKVTVPTSWGTSGFSNLSSTLYEDPDGDNTDVTGDNLSGLTVASGQVITTPEISGLTAGTKYRLDIQWDSSEGNQLVCYGIIYCNR